MAERVSKLGVKREPGFLYYLKKADLWRAPMKRAGGPSAAGKEEKVAEGNFNREDGYLYYFKDGDIFRSKRAVGGQKRKKKAAAPKKAAKKPAAKKPAAKKPAAKKAAKKKGKR